MVEEFKSLSDLSPERLEAFTGMVDLLQSVLDDIYSRGEEPSAPSSGREARRAPAGRRPPNSGSSRRAPITRRGVRGPGPPRESHVAIALQEGRPLPVPTFGNECPDWAIA